MVIRVRSESGAPPAGAQQSLHRERWTKARVCILIEGHRRLHEHEILTSYRMHRIASVGLLF
jgi:hypothetical protein